MSIVNWKLSVSFELDKAAHTHFNLHGGNFKSDLPNLVKVGVQDFIKGGDYKKHAIASAPVTDEEKNIIVQWNIPVDSTLDQSVRKIITTGNTDFKNNLSGFIEQAIRTYFFTFSLKLFGEMASGMNKSELKNFIKFMENMSDEMNKK
jgi:hypothetical protein